MDHDGLFKKWQKCMEQISEDVAEVLMHHMAFQEYPNEKGTDMFYRFFAAGYVAAAAMGVQRQLDTRRDVISFKKTLAGD